MLIVTILLPVDRSFRRRVTSLYIVLTPVTADLRLRPGTAPAPPGQSTPGSLSGLGSVRGGLGANQHLQVFLLVVGSLLE